MYENRYKKYLIVHQLSGIPWRRAGIRMRSVLLLHTFLKVQSITSLLSCLSCIWVFVTQWTSAWQAPMSLGFSRQEYCSRLPCPPPGDLPDSGIEPVTQETPALLEVSLLLSHWRMPQSFIQLTGYMYWSFTTFYTMLRRRQWHPTPVLLPGKSHGRRSLVGCSPWGR